MLITINVLFVVKKLKTKKMMLNFPIQLVLEPCEKVKQNSPVYHS